MLNYKATYDKTTGKVIVKWYDADGNEVPGEPGTYKVKVPADSFLWRGDGIGCEGEEGNEYYEYIYTILPDAPKPVFSGNTSSHSILLKVIKNFVDGSFGNHPYESSIVDSSKIHYSADLKILGTGGDKSYQGISFDDSSIQADTSYSFVVESGACYNTGDGARYSTNPIPNDEYVMTVTTGPKPKISIYNQVLNVTAKTLSITFKITDYKSNETGETLYYRSESDEMPSSISITNSGNTIHPYIITEEEHSEDGYSYFTMLFSYVGKESEFIGYNKETERNEFTGELSILRGYFWNNIVGSDVYWGVNVFSDKFDDTLNYPILYPVPKPTFNNIYTDSNLISATVSNIWSDGYYTSFDGNKVTATLYDSSNNQYDISNYIKFNYPQENNGTFNINVDSDSITSYYSNISYFTISVLSGFITNTGDYKTYDGTAVNDSFSIKYSMDTNVPVPDVNLTSMPDSIGSNGISAVCSGYSNISFMYADSSNLGYNTTAKDGSMKIMDSAGIATLLSSTAAVSGNYDNQSSVIFNTSSLRNTSFYESSINNVIIDLSSNTTLYNKSNTASLGNVNAVEKKYTKYLLHLEFGVRYSSYSSKTDENAYLVDFGTSYDDNTLRLRKQELRSGSNPTYQKTDYKWLRTYQDAFVSTQSTYDILTPVDYLYFLDSPMDNFQIRLEGNIYVQRMVSLQKILKINTSNQKDFYAFAEGCPSLSYITPELNVDKALCTELMFAGCMNLPSMTSNYNYDSVISASSMFLYDTSLNNLSDNISFKGLKYAEKMFGGCHSLSKLPDSFGPNNIISTESMFMYCSAITSFDNTQWTSTDYILDGHYMFDEMTNLIRIPKDWKFTGMTNAEALFYKCNSLNSISNASFDSVISANTMFFRCSSLTELNDTVTFEKVEDAHSMFEGCSSLITLGSKNNMQNIINANAMFYNCSALTGDVVINMNQTTHVEAMFRNCNSLESFKISNLGYSGLTNFYMDFRTCYKYSDKMVDSMVYMMNNVQDRTGLKEFDIYILQALYDRLKASSYYTGTDTQYATFRNVMDGKNNYAVKVV